MGGRYALITQKNLPQVFFIVPSAQDIFKNPYLAEVLRSFLEKELCAQIRL